MIDENFSDFKQDTLPFKDACNSFRAELKGVAKRVLMLKRHKAITASSLEYSSQKSDTGEMISNIVLAYRHLEDASMRLGKAIQAFDGGVSCYDMETQPKATEENITLSELQRTYPNTSNELLEALVSLEGYSHQLGYKVQVRTDAAGRLFCFYVVRPGKDVTVAYGLSQLHMLCERLRDELAAPAPAFVQPPKAFQASQQNLTNEEFLSWINAHAVTVGINVTWNDSTGNYQLNFKDGSGFSMKTRAFVEDYIESRLHRAARRHLNKHQVKPFTDESHSA